MSCFFLAIPVLAIMIAQPAATAAGQDAQAQPYAAIPLKSQSAQRVAKCLAQYLGDGANIQADEISNTIFIRATAEQIEKATRYVRRLDRIDRGSNRLLIVALRNANAEATTNAIKILLLMSALLGDDHEVCVNADPRTQWLIIAASEEDTEAIVEVIHRIDVSPK